MSLYSIIGVSQSASTSEIRKAYYAKAKVRAFFWFCCLSYTHQELHPDKNPGNEAAFVELSEAFQVLSDENKRAVYDKTGSVDPPEQQQRQGRPMDARDLFSFVFSQFFAAATASGQTEGAFFVPFEKSFFSNMQRPQPKPFGTKVSRYLDPERNVYVIKTTRVGECSKKKSQKVSESTRKRWKHVSGYH
jgi:DnaJ-class molecular chaperone